MRLVACVLALALPAVAAAAQGSVRATVFVNPLALELKLSTHEGSVGETVRAQVTASNRGSELLSDVVLTLRADPIGIVVGGSATHVVKRIRGGSTARVTWKICGAEAGRYLILARGVFTGPGGAAVTSESASELLQVEPSRETTCPRS